jgi:hypothetical protein
LVQERVGNTLELVGIGKNFLNGTPAAQQLRDSIDKWDFIKLKSFCSTKEMVSKLKRPPTEQVFIAALFIIAKIWKQPRCPTTDEWVMKTYLYTIEFYGSMKKCEILSFTSKWMELENIILSEVSLAQKTKIACSPSYADIRSRANTTRGLDFDHMIK